MNPTGACLLAAFQILTASPSMTHEEVVRRALQGEVGARCRSRPVTQECVATAEIEADPHRYVAAIEGKLTVSEIKTDARTRPHESGNEKGKALALLMFNCGEVGRSVAVRVLNNIGREMDVLCGEVSRATQNWRLPRAQWSARALQLDDEISVLGGIEGLVFQDFAALMDGRLLRYAMDRLRRSACNEQAYANYLVAVGGSSLSVRNQLLDIRNRTTNRYAKKAIDDALSRQQ